MRRIIHSILQTSGWPQWDFWVAQEKQEDANAWSLGDTPDEYQSDKLSFTVPRAGWHTTMVAQYTSHIPLLQDCEEPSPDLRILLDPAKLSSLGEHHPKANTPQTQCTFPCTTPKLLPVSTQSQLLQNKSRRPFSRGRVYFWFPRNQPSLPVASNLNSRVKVLITMNSTIPSHPSREF